MSFMRVAGALRGAAGRALGAGGERAERQLATHPEAAEDAQGTARAH